MNNVIAIPISPGVTIAAVRLTVLGNACRMILPRLRSERLAAWSRHRLAWLHLLNRGLVLASATLITASWLFGGITQDVIDHDGLAVSDNRLLHDVISHRSTVATAVAKGLTTLGTGLIPYGLLIVLGSRVWRRSRTPVVPIFCIAWLAAGEAVRLWISRTIGRPRPPQGVQLVHASGFAFPSGHTTTATIGYGLVAFLILTLTRTRRRLVVAGAALVATGVGLSRVYLGVHWPTDVLGGWSLGLSWLALAATVATSVRLLRARRSRSALNAKSPG